MGFSFTGESKTAKSGNLYANISITASLYIYIIYIYIDTVYIISLHQVFLVLLLSLFVSPNSQGPEDAGVSALRVFRSFCCVGLIHWCVPCRLVYHTVSICIRCIRYTLFIFVSSQGFGNSMAVVSLVHLASECHIRCWFSTFRTCFAPVKLARQFQEDLANFYHYNGWMPKLGIP